MDSEKASNRILDSTSEFFCLGDGRVDHPGDAVDQTLNDVPASIHKLVDRVGEERLNLPRPRTYLGKNLATNANHCVDNTGVPRTLKDTAVSTTTTRTTCLGVNYPTAIRAMQILTRW